MRAHTTYSMPMDGYLIDDHITPIPSRIPPKQRFEGKQGIQSSIFSTENDSD